MIKFYEDTDAETEDYIKDIDILGITGKDDSIEEETEIESEDSSTSIDESKQDLVSEFLTRF